MTLGESRIGAGRELLDVSGDLNLFWPTIFGLQFWLTFIGLAYAGRTYFSCEGFLREFSFSATAKLAVVSVTVAPLCLD